VATFLLEVPTTPHKAAVGTVSLVILCSPIRGADGAWRVLRSEVETPACLRDLVPATVKVARIIVNGKAVTPEESLTYPLLNGDEVLLIPEWGIPAAVLIPIVVGLVLSIATTYLSYVLFPPQKPHNIQQRPEEPSFSFEGIRTAIGPGAPVPVIYGRQRVGGQLLSSAVDQVYTVLESPATARRIRAIAAPATLSMLLAIGEGPVQALEPSGIQINGQPFANFPGVEVFTAMGTSPQIPLPYFGETSATFADGREIPEALSSMLYTTTQPVQAFVLNIVFNSGLYAFNAKGEKVDNLVALRYRHRPVGGSFLENWSPWEVVANRTSVVRFGIRVEGLPMAAYDIELQMTNVQSVTNAEWTPTLESVTEIQHSEFGYYDTALVGIRAIATDTLQGALPNITIEVLGRTVRVGSFGALPTWSDNPAWCVMDFMTNSRYGLGIPDSEIDLGAFQVWAAYCDQVIAGEKRHTLNYTLDRDVRAQQVMLEMMGGSRTLLVKTEGVWTPRPTRNDPPVQMLSWANCRDVRITYTRDLDRVNVIEARFANEDEDFEQDVLTWPVIEAWPAEVHKTSLEIRGVTKPSRIMRALQFELNRRQLENLELDLTCSLDALVLQPHDLFRFSHPLPGWGTSGRIGLGSTTDFLVLDTPVTFSGAHSYVVYVRHEDGTTEVRPVSYGGDVTMSTLTLLSSLSQTPVPRTSLWAFGYLLPPVDTAVKVFRVVRMQRQADATIRLHAVVHNASLYDEADALPLPIITTLFNPLGPPPPLDSLRATEVTRIQSSGASLRVVNLSWAVGPLGPGYAPYGGALVLRRTVTDSALGGSGGLGNTQAAAIQGSLDGIANYAPLTQLSGHVLDLDDYTVVTGQTYVYRVVPMSSRGVPNNLGALEVIIHVSGPTTPGFFPGTPLNLRLKGQTPLDTIFEGRDVHLEWDPLENSTLFSETFFIQDYVLEVWSPGQTYLMRRVIVPAGGPRQTMQWTYTLEQNAQDNIAAGQAGARRDLSFYLWARTNTGRISLDPAVLTVTNPPPDMSDMIPTATPIPGGAKVEWDQFVEPRDFDHYEIHLDTMTPPLALYSNLAIAFTGQGSSFRYIFAQDLTLGTTYYAYVLPYDTFGPGLASHIVSFQPGGIDANTIEHDPPAVPSGLILVSGVTISDDGTVLPWVEARWAPNTESDLAAYEVHFRLADSAVPSVFTVDKSQNSVRIESVPGNVTIFARMLAYDQFHNASVFTPEVSITTSADLVPPAAPSNLTAISSIRSIALLWTPPPDLDYAHGLVYASQVNDFATAVHVGEGHHSFVYDGLGPNATWFFWLKSIDTSGNLSIGTFPSLATNGVGQIAGLLDTTFISSLAVDKLLAGTLDVFVQMAVGGRVFLDGVNGQIYIYDTQATPRLRVRLGKLGPLASEYGLEVFNALGQMMFHAANGVTAVGIQAGTISAGHLVADQVVITGTAQIANGIIGDAQITGLTADKILAGTLDVLVGIGVGAAGGVFLDGTNRNITVIDEQPTPVLRVALGRLGPAPSQYGLRIWDQFGQLVWDFNGLPPDSVTTPIIAPAAVTTTRVETFAITSSLSFTSVATLNTTGAEAAAATLTFPSLDAGDDIWLMGVVVGQTTAGGDTLRLNLRHDSVSGTGIAGVDFISAGKAPLTVQGVVTMPSAATSKTFVLSFLNATSGATVAVYNVYFVAFRRRR
jgi:hypothetical protein